MLFSYLFRVFVLSPFLFKCYEGTGVIGNNPAIVKELRRSLTAGWRAELTDLKNEQSSEPLLKSRSGGENPEGETPGGEATGGGTSGNTEKLGEKQMRLVEWHLADEPLKQFNAWVPPEGDQQRLDDMKNKVDGYLTDLQSTIDFSGVQNVNDELKAEFKESIEDIREHLVDEDVPAERITNVKSLVKEIFENSLMTKTSLKGKIAKQLKGTPKALKDKMYDFKETIEKIQQPEVVDLRGSGATGKKVFRVLQGFLGIAENRGWRTNGKWTTFKIPFAQREEGFAFQLKRALWGAGQLLYNVPGGNYGDTKYVEDYYPELTKPVELNKFKGLYYDFFNNPDTKPVDLSSFHDAGKKELQAAISAIQEQLKKPDLDTDHKKKIQDFSKKLLYTNNPGIPEDLEDSVKEELETLKTEVQKFKTTKKEEQKKIAKFMLDTIENDKDNQPPWSDVPGLDENPELQSVISDFVVLTNVVESCPPTRAQLEFFKDKGILDTSEENMELLKEHEGIKWSVSGRTLGLDSVMRDRLRRFINDQLDASLDDLGKVFSVKEFPAVERPGGTKGARNWAGSHQDEALSPPSSQEMDFLSQSPGPSTSGLNTEKQPDSMEVTEAREVLTDEFRNVDNLGELSDESISVTEDNTESAAKRPRLEADADYTEDVALNSLNCPIKRHFSHDKRQDICSVKDKLVLDEESIELKGNKLQFEFHEPHNKNARYKVSTEIDQSRLSSLKYVGEKEKYNEHTGKSKGLRGKIGTAFGVHGLVMSVFGSINAFQRGDTVSGAITVAQTMHSLQSFESVKKLSDFAADIGKKALQKAVLAGAEKLGLSEIAERATTKLARLAESDAGLLLGDIPFVGLAFDAYFIANDIKDLTTANFSDAGEVALDVVHLALDIGTTVANMLVDTLGPEFEPVVWALSLIRMAVDDFYIDITEELKKAHGTAQKILAVFKGIAEGFVDFITGGLLRGIKQLNERKKHDQELLAKLANPKSYFKLQGTDCEGAAGTIDFTAGEFSGQGGEIKFKLNDDDSFTVQLTGVPAEGGEKQTITKKFQCKGLKDIVLGVGETQDAVWTKQKAKLWGVITVKSAEVIDKFKANDGSLYGSYTGNSKNNAFYAFQGNLSKVLKDECKDPDATGVIDLRIANYLYLLNGMAGNDSFLLGPQKAHVTGGSGHDLYYLGTHGGNTVIDNFAFDKLGDTLWLNVSHVHVVCGRKDYDLLITYCGTHLVQIKEWFFPVRNEFQRHLILLTRDGIQLKVKDMGVKDDTYQVACVPVSIDRSKSLTSQRLILTDEQYREVVTVTGSKTNDYIIGNDKDNFINAGPGFNIIKGGEGSDTYILKSGNTGNIQPGLCDIIDNHANDLAQDKIFLPMNFTDIVLTAAGILPVLPEKGNKPGEESGNKIGKEIGKETGKETGKEKWKENRLIDVNKINKVLQTETDLKISHNLKDKKNGIKDKQNEIEDTQNEISGGKCVQIKDWFEGKNYKHLTFVTEDYVVFHVNGSQKDAKAQPSMLDYSMSPKGVTCDLKGKNALKHLKGVQTVLDSYHEDTIYGNDAPNFLSSHGNDFVQGNGGKDIYKIAENCRNTIINNYDQHKERDVIFIEQEFDDLSVSMENTKKSLQLLTGGTDKVLAFLHWFKNETYRHATVRTKDGVTALFPSSISEMSAMKNKLKATEISLDREDCNKKLKEYDLSEEHYKGVLRFTAKSDLCSYKVIGNEQNNYIDPGPGNPYGYQYLEGGIGADTYVIGSNYGEFNEINNYATDDKIDFVLLNVKFKHIKVGIKDDTADLILRSTSKYNKVSVVLKGFLYGKEYQHMLLQSADRVLFRLLPHYPHRKAVIVNYAESKHSQILNLTDTFPDAGIFYGAKQHHNVIYGSDSSRKLSAGFKKDTVVGGKLGETIEGLSGDDTINGEAGNDAIYGGDGNDIITGNEGNDVIYGGNGADRINGSDGMDTVLFKGDSIKAKGVTISLKGGHGRSADAEGDVYTSVEAVIGSEFDDVIEGDDFNNILSGNSGEDTIIAHGGYDILVGGQDSDLYNFTRASGKKIVNNYATDGKTDILWFGKTTQPLCFYSYKNDLFVHFAMDYNKNIDLMLKEWYNGSEFQHASLKYININDASKHSHLKHYKDKKGSLMADEWVVLFKERAKVKIINYGNDFVTAKVDYTLKTIPTDMYSIYLNYISEGEEYRKIDISNMIRPGGTQIKLKPIASGIITSVSLSLHRCSQVLAMTSPVTQRTSPNPPSNFVITHLSDVSITVQWKLPTDLNREFYKFRCIAEESGAIDNKVESQPIARTTTSANATSCLIDGLKARTRYYISITSIAGGEISQEVAVIKQTTKHICHRTSVPRNGKITDAQKINGIKMATVACDFGYELSVVDMKGTTLSKIWPTKPLVVCNSTMPCVKWTNGECTEKVKCLEKSCDESVLAAKRLEPKGSGNSEYLHGNTVTLGCINGFRFTNDEDPHGTVDIICWNGNWKNLPKCREIKNCNLLPVENGYIKIGEQRFGVSGGNNIQLNHELEAQFHCNHGYTLEGTDETRCIDGMLVPNPVKVPPRCRIIDCPSIASPQNGNAALQPSGSPVHGSRYTFSCDSKYFLTGPRTKDCDAGTWKPSGNPRCNPKPCNQYPCQNNGACHNVGNYNYRCACGSKWQGQTCQYRKVIREDLNKELQNSLSQNGGTSNDDYRDLLWNYLAQRYTYYYWYVGAYHPTGGWDNHAVTGQYMCFFRTHGRNLVVTWALRSSWKLPSNMDETMKKFERKLTGQGCDPRTINNMALRYGRNDLNYPTIMAHTVGWGNGLRSHYHTAFAFHLNYKCRGSSHISVIVAFGEQPWSPGPDRCKRGF